jgi:hypothetical protein
MMLQTMTVNESIIAELFHIVAVQTSMILAGGLT